MNTIYFYNIQAELSHSKTLNMPDNVLKWPIWNGAKTLNVVIPSCKCPQSGPIRDSVPVHSKLSEEEITVKNKRPLLFCRAQCPVERERESCVFSAPAIEPTTEGIQSGEGARLRRSGGFLLCPTGCVETGVLCVCVSKYHLTRGTWSGWELVSMWRPIWADTEG